MDDDKQDKPGSGDAAKRSPPTIDLAASDVSESTPASDAPSDVNEAETPASENLEPSPATKAPSRVVPIFTSVLAGAAAAALVLGVAKSTGWLDAQPPRKMATRPNSPTTRLPPLSARLSVLVRRSGG